LVACSVGGLGEAGKQGSKGGIVGVVVLEMQDGLDFFGGLAASAGEGH
jgi:hypothetical protein